MWCCSCFAPHFERHVICFLVGQRWRNSYIYSCIYDTNTHNRISLIHWRMHFRTLLLTFDYANGCGYSHTQRQQHQYECDTSDDDVYMWWLFRVFSVEILNYGQVWILLLIRSESVNSRLSAQLWTNLSGQIVCFAY